MGTKKLFTAEEVEILGANKYTKRVTVASISYTTAFKEAFWDLSLQGCTGTAAFRKLGYDPEILGFERIHNTTKRIRRAAQTPKGLCEDSRCGVKVKRMGFAEADMEGLSQEEAAKRMQHEIIYLQQQMAFFKKVMRLGQEDQ